MSRAFRVQALLLHADAGLPTPVAPAIKVLADPTFDSITDAVEWMQGGEGDAFAATCHEDVPAGYYVHDIRVVAEPSDHASVGLTGMTRAEWNGLIS